MIMNEMNKTKVVETSLVLTTGFVGLYFVFKKPVFLIIAFAFGITGIFIPFLARFIAIAWFKLADVLNFVVSKIVLGFVYFIVLVPVAFIYKMVGKDKLSIKKRIESNWMTRSLTVPAFRDRRCISRSMTTARRA